MASANSLFPEGNSINRPPIFNGEGYHYWKTRMQIFIETIDLNIWEAIEIGPYIPTTVERVSIDGSSSSESITIEKPRDRWSEEDRKRVQYNLKAKNIITSALGMDEYFRVSNCKSAKEMWDTLRLTHEGTTDVKRSRINALTHEYELFRMNTNENIQSMQKRFTHIVNHLAALGKEFQNEDLINKVLRCLSREWQPKVTAISESRDLSNMSLATLFGKLQEHEMELLRLHQNEENDKKRKGIALKASSSIQEESDQDNDADDDDDLSFFVKRFNKFLKVRGNQRRPNFKSKRRTKNSSSTLKCFECNQPGHLRVDCPIFKKKMEKSEKKNHSEKKLKKAYITWDENDLESSDDSENEEINLCLMAKSYESDEEVTSSNNLSISFDELQDAFADLHKESIKLAKLVSSSKKTISNLENEISKLNKELDLLRNEVSISKTNEKVNISTINDKKITDSCSCCDKYVKEIKELKNSLAKFSYSRNNLDVILSKQRYVSNKNGLGYKSEKLQKVHKNFSTSTQKCNSNSITCFYCGRRGHGISTCYFKKNYSNIKMIWVPKGSSVNTNMQGPNKIWVPKSKT